MASKRSSGVLLHPTSLPGPHGIGDLGSGARRFVDFLVEARQSLWQVLPLGPTGYGDSPYASFSSFAGNPLLIALEGLLAEGDLQASDLQSVPAFPPRFVDYGWVIFWKLPLLEKAARTFLESASGARRAAYDRFCAESDHWLRDYALFMAVKEEFDARARESKVDGAMWNNFWDADIALREPAAIRTWSEERREKIEVQKVLQFYFFSQWRELRAYANTRGVRLVGDIPIFVAPDSVDVWADRRLFHLDERGRPNVVAGVPPDYFSATGQRWGNPLYNWEVMRSEGFSWWTRRVKSMLGLVDIVRVDHFRGFEAYWEVPAANKTAEKGRWVKAPGRELFTVLERELGELPVMAEDLGVITPEVVALRDHFGFPGMKVLQFAFEPSGSGLNATNPFLPHNFTPNSVVYTGTHDNDTTRGWYRTRSDQERDLVRRYLARDDGDVVWDLIRLAYASVAHYAIIPMQDLLVLESNARMNRPSTLGGNWAWRYSPEDIGSWTAGRLREMTELYGRVP